MGNPYFQFKQFTVFHDLCAMKVGIDGVLLGSWANVGNAKRILDVGTGSGLIALMLAQRTPEARITAIDIDPNAILQSKANIDRSPWPDRIKATCLPLQEYAKLDIEKFDLIVSNPPYFSNSLKTPDSQRTLARHNDTLPHNELIISSKSLLRENGKLCLILPVNEGNQCIEIAAEEGLHCTQKVYVYPKPNAPVKRLLLEFSMSHGYTTESEICIETETRHQYSPEFTALAKDFYLKL